MNEHTLLKDHDASDNDFSVLTNESTPVGITLNRKDQAELNRNIYAGNWSSLTNYYTIIFCCYFINY